MRRLVSLLDMPRRSLEVEDYRRCISPGAVVLIRPELASADDKFGRERQSPRGVRSTVRRCRSRHTLGTNRP